MPFKAVVTGETEGEREELIYSHSLCKACGVSRTQLSGIPPRVVRIAAIGFRVGPTGLAPMA